MSCLCPLPYLAPYSTGVIPDSGERLSHPGGLALTLRALQLSGLHQGRRILDLGCGSGESLQLLHSLGFDAIGVDVKAVNANGHPMFREQAHRICASSAALPFAAGSFDGILAECSLSVMEERDQVLNECSRVLAPGGRLIISDLYARNPAAINRVRALDRSCIAGMISHDELQADLKRHGFAIDMWEDHSQSLREFVARFLMYNDSLNSLWSCKGEQSSAQEVQDAMKVVRAGYFLLIASRPENEGTEHE